MSEAPGHAELSAFFARVLAAPPEMRSGMLDEVCGEDRALREELISLMAAYESSGNLFDRLEEDVVSPARGAIVKASDKILSRALMDTLRSRLAGNYAIDAPVAGGAMSRVFLAEEIGLGRKVALKVLPPEMAATVNIERFRREIQLAAQLQHAHIVPVLTTGVVDELLYYTMPYVSGETLRSRIAREGALPVREAIRTWRDILDALAYAHARGVIHRDIKPENVLLADRNALVADFGIARAVAVAAGGAYSTEPGLAIGTPMYMAPEQACGEPDVDHRADIYSAGLVMYEMLNGQPPFHDLSSRALIVAHTTREPAAIERADAPTQLIDLVRRCIAKEPAARPSSADAILAELERIPAIPGGGQRRVRQVALGAFALIVLLPGAAAVIPLLGRAPSTETSRPMLVVLPFQNVGPSEDQYFADGITEELIARLASLRGLGVISRSSAWQYRATTKPLRQIGRELNVGYVLDGTIRWAKRPDGSSRVRVSPELIKISDDTHLWAQTYDADLKDVFQIQSDIADHVAQALNVALLSTRTPERPPTTNVEAYQYYLRGNEYWNRGFAERDFRAAADLYERAVAVDPQFALAWAKLARQHLSLHEAYYDRTEARLEAARRAAARALALQPDLPEAHVAQGLIHSSAGDYERALQEFNVARSRVPNDAELIAATASVLRQQGKFQDAARNLEQVVTLDPRSARSILVLGSNYEYMRDFDAAIRWFTRALSITPDDALATSELARLRAMKAGSFDPAHQLFAEALNRRGATEFAREFVSFGPYVCWPMDALGPELLRAVAALPRSDTDPASFFGCKADVFAALGDTARARVYYDSTRREMESLIRERPDEGWYRGTLAIVYAKLGRSADAVREGRRAAELLPVERDAAFGPDMLELLAEVYTRVGEIDSAVTTIERLLAIPSYLSVPRLRMESVWDPLRSNPRFQRLLSGR